MPEYANDLSLKIKQKNGGDSRTWEKNEKVHMLQLNSLTLMNRVQFTSSESLPSDSFSPKERDHCAFDLQQIGRLVAHHSAITQAFIYLHMQACMKNV